MPRFAKLIGASRFFAVVGVVCALALALLAFAWAGRKVVVLCAMILRGESAGIVVGLVQGMDAILIGAGLLVFALGLHELFISSLPLPAWLAVNDFDALKAKLASVVTLVMAVSFLERLETADDPRDLLFSGIAVALVSGSLIAFSRLHHR